MKRIRVFSLLLSLLVLVSVIAAPAASALQTVTFEPSKDTTITAQAALVVHLASTADRDAVLYAKNTVAPMAPAGMVRIMVGITALTIIEEKGLDPDTATGTYTDACYQAIAGTGIPTAGMLEGDTWTLRDLLTIATIHSAGDVVETLAMTLAGDEASFVERMNALAAEIGCTDTRFKNVHGLDDPEQVSTVMDVYRMLRHAMDIPALNAILSLSHYSVSPKKGAAIILPTSNNLLRISTDSYYESALLGRAGWSDLTGPSVAAVARADGYEYMVVVMGCSQKAENSHFADARALFRWAFRDFTLVNVRTKNDPVANVPLSLCSGQDQVQLVPKNDVTAVIPSTLDLSSITVKPIDLPESLQAPVQKGQVYGRAAFYTPDGQQIAEVELVADQTLERSHWLYVWYCIGRFFSSGWFWGIFLLLLTLIVGYVALTIQHNKKRRRQNQRRVRPHK